MSKIENISSTDKHLLRVKCRLPIDLTAPTILSVTHSRNQYPSMNGNQTQPEASLFHQSTSKFLNPRRSCQICKRFIYSFEEILNCRFCQSSTHWRCLKSETISYYDNSHFVCEKCNDSLAMTTSSTSSNIKTKSPDDSETETSSKVNDEKKVNSREKTSKPNTLSDTVSNRNDFTKIIQSENSLKIQVNKGFQPTSKMFQANYHYTPLKDFAALRNVRTINESKTNVSYSNPHNDRQQGERSTLNSSNQRYVEYQYDPNRVRLVDVTQTSSARVSSPNVNQRQPHHYISTTNLSVNEAALQRQNELNFSTPHLSRVGHDDSNRSQESGISSTNFQQSNSNQESAQQTENKLVSLVQQLAKQVESETKKLDEKLENRLNELEKLIQKQTFIIQEQDQKIESLNSKVQQLEIERDQMRFQLNEYEREINREPITNIETTIIRQEPTEIQRETISERKISTSSSSSSDTSRSLIPAATIGQLIQSIPTNQGEAHSGPSASSLLIGAVPLHEKPVASNLSDETTKNEPNAGVYMNFSTNDNRESVFRSDYEPLTNFNQEQKLNRSNSSISTVSSGTGARDENYRVQGKPSVSSMRRTSETHRSLDTFPMRTENNEDEFRSTNRNLSMTAISNSRPIGPAESTIVDGDPKEASHPANQSESPRKGWLKKMSRDSFLRRVERFYCVLTQEQLLLHKQENDKKPQKAINLKGAKATLAQDPKYGNSVDLTWSNALRDIRRYLLIPDRPDDANLWHHDIQQRIENLNKKN